MKDAFYNWRPKIDEDDDIQVYQRTWVGLTDDEAQQAFKRHNCDISKDLAGILARDIEAKLKEKNYG